MQGGYVMEDVTELQSKMIDLILEGKKMTEVSQELGIYRSQLYRWLKNEKVKAELETRRIQLRKSASDRITGNVESLVDKMLTLANESTDNRVKYNAIKYLLDRCLGTPTAAKVDDLSNDNVKDKDDNALLQELGELKIIK